MALITDNESIYQKRALPMIEYLMSREKYLFTINKSVTRQNASSRMNGPAMEVSELAVLHSYFKDRNPVFRFYADSLKNTSRKLNLSAASPGDSWPNLLGLYRMNHDATYLRQAEQKAEEYIKRRIDTKQTDFRESSIDNATQFWTDFSPLWMELLDLYEATGNQRYLDAATQGAKLYMEYIWFYPVIPDSSILINEGGVVSYRCFEAVRDNVPLMAAPEQLVPAWRVSQIGLTPEASNTLPSNPAIFLTHYAAHLLRLAHYTNNDFFRSVARSAVVGRYSNYPGYDINGIFNTVYSRPDYPLRAMDQISYNQFYYNHVWPHIALLFDYLVSDVYALSGGKISFPHHFAPGYAYLKSKVYGHETGSFYGQDSVQLYMPKQVLAVDNEQINFLTGYGKGKFYIALTNQSDEDQEVQITLNPDLVPVNLSGSHAVNVWQQNQPGPATQVVNGKIKVRVARKGITALAVDGITIATHFQHKAAGDKAQPLAQDSYKFIHSPFGKITSSFYSLGEYNSAYTWLEATSEQLQKATLYYRPVGTEKWQTQEDNGYPFEFTIPLKDQLRSLEIRVEGISKEDGKVQRSPSYILNGVKAAIKQG